MLSSSNTGVLVIGREHYFDDHDEIKNALGIQTDVLWIQTPDEFTEAQISEFFESTGAYQKLPEWMPRKPLVCQMISGASEEDLTELLNSENKYIFWNKFLDYMASRDAQIGSGTTKESIRQVLIKLARKCRQTGDGLGPLTLQDMSEAFEELAGAFPIENAAAMLQRLPGLGRVEFESDNRQFVDPFIVNGLQATAVVEAVQNFDSTYFTGNFIRGLSEETAQIIIDAAEVEELGAESFVGFLNQNREAQNGTAKADMIVLSSSISDGPLNYKSVIVGNA